jgi:glyoxylase-like metal-dependent hydrolase (beta-lactamase superfamily II)
MQWGDVTLIPLRDGEFRLDGGAMFGTVPKPLWERRAPADALNRISLALRPLLIRTPERNILIDAGIGGKMSAKAVEIYGIDRAHPIDAALAGVGLAPQDIDLVIASHLHFDHAGGFTAMVDGALAPAFPRAQYVIRRGEWEDATHPHARNRASYLADDFRPLEAAGVVTFVEEDGEVAPGVSVWRTGGHTMHHQIVRIESAGRVAVFAADLMPTAAHVEAPWIMGYDLYPVDTLRYKERFLREAIAGEYLVFFEHDPHLAAGILRPDGTRVRVEPVEV